MTKSIANPRLSYRLVTILILFAGLGSALVIYLMAGIPDESTMVSEFEGSKRFVHDLELYGGKANVLADKFVRWFEGLWQGKSLAFTVAFLTVIIAAAYFLVARQLTSHSIRSDVREESRSEPE